MTQCNHDPLFTTDGRCSKCHPPRYASVVMEQHVDGTVETHPGWMASQEQRIEDVKPLCDETMRRYHDYTAQLTDDEIALMKARCNDTAHDDAKDDAMGRPW